MKTTTTSPQPATLPGRLTWIRAILFSLIPVICTAAASAAAQILEVDDATGAWLIAGGAAVSAIIGIVVMIATKPSLRAFGWQSPKNLRAAWWLLPLPLTLIVAVATQGVHVSTALLGAYAVLTIVVAVNEEVWFRGVVLAILRTVNVRTAIIGSAILFGVLHLANLASGQASAASILQVVFAIIFGFVAAEVVVVTRSLWPVIVWHAAWDFVNFIGGNSLEPIALGGIGAACVIMVIYAVALWRKATTTNA